MPFTKEEMQEELARFLTLFKKQIASLYGSADDVLAQNDLIEKSDVWTAVEEMYDYGVMGIPTGPLGPGSRINGIHAHIESFLRAMDTPAMKRYLNALDNTPPRLAICAVQSAVARIVLDGGKRFTDFGEDQYGLGNGDSGYLTLAEVALLANMDERSVRNAANPKLQNPLKTEQVGKRSLVKPEEARRWLAGRKGYISTQERENYIPHRPPEWDLTLPQELGEQILREAEIEHEKTGVLPSIYIEKRVMNFLVEAVKKLKQE